MNDKKELAAFDRWYQSAGYANNKNVYLARAAWMARAKRVK